MVNPLAPAWLTPTKAGRLDEPVWPATVTRDAAGQLTIDAVAAADLVREFGSPLYVLSESEFRCRAVELREALEGAAASIGTSAALYYAGKSLLTTEVARWACESGFGIDVASGGELEVALAAGVDPSRLGLHGNNKSDHELTRALEVGVGTVVLDNRAEIGRVARAAQASGRTQSVRLRVNSGVHAHTHEYLATAHEDQKFGVPLTDAAALVAEIRAESSLSFVGLHCHIGSQIFDAAGFAESARRLIAVYAELAAGGPVPELNLGGGFGIAYVPSDRPSPNAEIARGIADAVQQACRRHDVPVPRLVFEPGRSISGPAGITLYTVGAIKDVTVAAADGQTAVRRYVSVDGGMSDNVRPALYGADYTVALASRSSDADPVLVRVAGKHCESGDIVVDAGYLPADVAAGDLLAVAATGAYCWSLSSNYNYVPRPALVAVRDGAARAVVAGETVADLLARDLGVRQSTAPATTHRTDPNGEFAR